MTLIACPRYACLPSAGPHCVCVWPTRGIRNWQRALLALVGVPATASTVWNFCKFPQAGTFSQQATRIKIIVCLERQESTFAVVVAFARFMVFYAAIVDSSRCRTLNNIDDQPNESYSEVLSRDLDFVCVFKACARQRTRPYVRMHALASTNRRDLGQATFVNVARRPSGAPGRGARFLFMRVALSSLRPSLRLSCLLRLPTRAACAPAFAARKELGSLLYERRSSGVQPEKKLQSARYPV